MSPRFVPRGRDADASARPFIAGEGERSDLAFVRMDAVADHDYAPDTRFMPDAELGGPHRTYEAFIALPQSESERRCRTCR